MTEDKVRIDLKCKVIEKNGINTVEFDKAALMNASFADTIHDLALLQRMREQESKVLEALPGVVK